MAGYESLSTKSKEGFSPASHPRKRADGLCGLLNVGRMVVSAGICPNDKAVVMQHLAQNQDDTCWLRIPPSKDMDMGTWEHKDQAVRSSFQFVARFLSLFRPTLQQVT
jgi:hypothetical protein